MGNEGHRLACLGHADPGTKEAEINGGIAGLTLQFFGKRHVGNQNDMEIHDLDFDGTRPNGSQINEFSRSSKAITLDPDTFREAHRRRLIIA